MLRSVIEEVMKEMNLDEAVGRSRCRYCYHS